MRAAESGSFSATARKLGLSQPSVSRIVSELEARLGTKLLLRSTRQITPTEAGTAFLQRARQILHDLEDADESARGTDSLRGVLRIALSSILSVRVVIPSLPVFLKTHPLLKLELLATDSMQDLVAEAADMAIRFGRLENSGFGVKKLATMQRVLLASPSYLEARGMPQTLADLAAHDCIFGPSGSPTAPWTFRHEGAMVSIKVEPRFQATSADATIACAREGLGIVRASALICRNEIQSGQLVPVLPGYLLDPVDLHAVFPSGRIPSQKVQMFTAYLSEVLAKL
ncbi:LysR family transcriptional regulator [Undibacterium terreum]|uniref:LysR family transcriptional regulator n=1 Tax=Undibacterium terreum TaxID=1224302 RepID=A0A916UUE6_9BURK|nr:LysR family transcriptional regulator [Undibacterium terreum]